MSKTYVVAGAGFRGFCDAMELLKVPGNKVHIVEPAPFFGGIAYSREVKGFAVDKGVHVFDSIPVDLADIVNEIMDGHTKTIEFVSASAFNGVVTDGFSLPDLASLDEGTKAKIKDELLALAKLDHSSDNPANLGELFRQRFGETAGGVFGRIFEKVYSIHPDRVEASGLSVTSLHRLKFLGDPEMVELKKDPWLDTVLAARRKAVGKVDDFVSIYPDTGEAMKGWCDRAAKWLEAKGAVISYGEKITAIKDTASGVSVTTDKQVIEADKVIWANDNVAALAGALGFEADLKGLQHGTPMVFATLITQAKQIKDFTYLQNFEPDAFTYRTAAAGLFSNQIKEDGTSFITCECPAAIGSDTWERSDEIAPEIWAECQALGIVQEDAELLDHEVIRIPSTFKPALVGFTDKIAEIYAEIPKHSERVHLHNVEPFFRRDIYLDSLGLNEKVA